MVHHTRHLIILSLLVTVQLAWGQTPYWITYQGVLKDGNEDLVNGTREITFKLFDALTGGTEWWSETHTSVAVTDGIFNVELGSITSWYTPDPPVLFDLTFWLEIQVTGDTGPLTPRTQFTAVPYSLAARRLVGSRNVFPSRGNVGIGTTSPGANLHITSPDLEGILLSDSSSSKTSASLINWETYGGQLNLYDASGNTGARIRGYANPSGVQAAFTAGNVGIGTATPVEKLDIYGNMQVNGYIKGISTGSDLDLRADFYLLKNLAGDSEWVRIQNGNVGIGTTSPSAPLHVRREGGTYEGLAQTILALEPDLATRDAGFSMKTTRNPGRIYQMRAGLGYAGASNNLYFIDQTAYQQGAALTAASRMVFDTTGNVGIGTVIPAAKLDVVGGIKADSIELATAAERWYAISHHAFDPWSGSPVRDIYKTYHNSAGSNVNFSAPVQLPHGATITEFMAVISDTVANNMKLEIVRQTNSTGSIAALATLNSIGVGVQTLNSGTISPGQVVDNQNYTYLISANWRVPWWGATFQPDDTYLRAVRIKYTVDRPLP
jgi:hypothetical protein